MSPKHPIKVLQFGEGNFLRAFADWCVEKMNKEIAHDAGVAVVQPINRGIVNLLQKQEGVYHHIMRGLSGGNVIDEINKIECIQTAINPFEDAKSFFDLAASEDLQVVISNTTEAGIQFQPDDFPAGNEPARTFPGKLTQFLKKRFGHFENTDESGLVFIPCELINNNGSELRKAILEYARLWNYGSEFETWIASKNYFANTLVDRIVPGYPKDEINEIHQKIDFEDQLVVSSEVFHLWVIQGPKEVQEAFPADTAGLNVKFVDDITPYRTRKVRILNGAHTCMVPLGLLDGIETVKEVVEHEVIGEFIQSAIDEEISPTIDLPKEELEAFSNEVIERFKNPFIRHELKSIALNSFSKFTVRVLPTIKDYLNNEGVLPKKLLFSLACLIKLYQDTNFQINDDQSVVAYFEELKASSLDSKVLAQILSQHDFWGEDLTAIEGLEELINSYINHLNGSSVTKTIDTLF